MILRDVVEFCEKGVNIEKSLIGDVMYIPSGAVFPEFIKKDKCYKIVSETSKIKSDYFLKNGDVLFNTGGVGTLGRVGFYNLSTKAVCDPFVLILRGKEGVLDNRYLFYQLQSNRIKDLIFKNTVGSTGITSIKKSDILSFPIHLPTLATQKRIAEILDAANALRRKDQELLKKYDELAQSIFIDMFGDPVKNEMGWDVNKGRNVVKVLGGAAFKSTDYEDDGIPLIRIGTINKGYFNKSQIVFLPSDFAISHERYIVKPKDLLITLTGTVGKDDYGNVYVMEDHFDQYLLNQRVAKLIVKQDYLMTRFFEFLLKQKEVKAELTGVSRGVRQANISNEDIYNLDVISPPMALQNDFVERINNVYGLMATSTNSSLVSDILFNSLIQKAFNGELVS